ncbi:MAG: flagellar protein FlgN [Candidatus Magnetoovum sp. WYHC-5]|nr:flagellar protein FlgN [Candidatus Magnetoovum sp. WYHC-5]
MKSAIAIKKILKGQVEGYRGLLELLKEERQCLIDFNEEGIHKLAKEKDTLVLKLRLYEEERVRLVKQFAKELEAAMAANASDETAEAIDTATKDNAAKDNNDKGKEAAGRSTNISLSPRMSLRDISDLTGDAEFLNIRSQMRTLAQGIEEFNEFNKFLIDRSLKHLKSTADFLRTLGVHSNPVHKGTILTKEA